MAGAKLFQGMVGRDAVDTSNKNFLGGEQGSEGSFAARSLEALGSAVGFRIWERENRRFVLLFFLVGDSGGCFIA